MFKTRGGGQRPFEQCSKKLHNWYVMASLALVCPGLSWFVLVRPGLKVVCSVCWFMHQTNIVTTISQNSVGRGGTWIMIKILQTITEKIWNGNIWKWEYFLFLQLFLKLGYIIFLHLNFEMFYSPDAFDNFFRDRGRLGCSPKENSLFLLRFQA